MACPRTEVTWRTPSSEIPLQKVQLLAQSTVTLKELFEKRKFRKKSKRSRYMLKGFPADTLSGMEVSFKCTTSLDITENVSLLSAFISSNAFISAFISTRTKRLEEVEVTSLVELATDSWQVSNLTPSHSLHQSESFLVEGILFLGFLVGWDWSTQTIGVMKENASGARKP